MLHIVNRSPYQSRSIEQCLNQLQPNDALLLIEDAVYAALKNSRWQSSLTASNAKLYVLESDLMARGLSDKPLSETIKQVDYSGFVELTENHTPIHSWS